MDNLSSIKEKIAQLPRNSYWQIGQKTGQFLRQSVIEVNAKNVLEIGTSSGYSALWIVEGLIKTNGHLYTIESKEERYNLANKHFKEANVEKYITSIKGHAPECIPNIKIDLAFIDATKRDTISFLEAISGNLNVGSRIIIDNVNSHAEKFKNFYEYLETKNFRYEKIDIEDGLIVIYWAS